MRPMGSRRRRETCDLKASVKARQALAGEPFSGLCAWSDGQTAWSSFTVLPMVKEGRRRAVSMSALVNGQTESGLTIAVAVIKHVKRPVMLENKRILDHLRVPACGRYIDT